MNSVAVTFPLQRQKFHNHLNVIALALVASSFIYLIAANWWMLATWVQLSMAPTLLLLSAVASVILKGQDSIRQTLHGICGLMLGLSLAVIGQVYQTGADSYLLFLVWSVLLLPWLYQPNIGVFTLLSIVSQIALILFFKQTFWLEQWPVAYITTVNLLSLLCFVASLKNYSALKYVLLFYFALISVSSMWLFIGEGEWFYLISSLFLPVLSFIYFNFKKNALGSSLAALTIGISITVWLVVWIIEHQMGSSFEMLFSLALVIFLWFGLISVALMRMLPQTRFHVIPLAFGAWLAGLLLGAALLAYWENVSLFIGLIFILGSSAILKKNRQLFLRQLAYCLLICGQVALMWHSAELTDSMWMVLLLQVLMLVLSLYLRCHWLMITLQMIACYSIAQIQLMEWFGYRWNDISQIGLWSISALSMFCYGLIFVLEKISNISYRRSILLFILVLVMLNAAQYMFLLQYDPQFNRRWDWSLALPMIWIGLSGYFILKNQLNLVSALAVIIFAVLATLLGYFEIYLLLLILAWTLQIKDKLVYAFSLVSLIFLLWQLYYNLELSFLLKSLSIFISGLLLLILGLILKKHNQHLDTMSNHDASRNQNNPQNDQELFNP